jgi:hypothetical protein
MMRHLVGPNIIYIYILKLIKTIVRERQNREDPKS